MPALDSDSLPFSESKQGAVLGHCIYDEQIYKLAIHRLSPDVFSYEIHQRIFEALQKWHKRWSQRPSVSELLESDSLVVLPNETLSRIRAYIHKVQHDRAQYAIEPLFDEVEKWLKVHAFKNGVQEMVHLYNARKDPDGAISVANGLVKKYHDIRFKENREIRFANYGADLLEQIQDYANSMTIGLTAIDRIIDNEASVGACHRGETTLFLAGTNVGKTTVLVTQAVANIMRGKHVLFLFHEGTERELKNKFMRCASRMQTAELRKTYSSPETLAAVQPIEAILDEYLTLVPSFGLQMTIEKVGAEVEIYQDRLRMRLGKYYDLVIDDYPAKLSTEQASKGHMAPRFALDTVYGQFVQVALRYNCHVSTAMQANREGNRLNKHIGAFKYDRRLLNMEDAGEAFGPMQSATNVISINRSPDVDAPLNKLTALLCKTRNSPDVGVAVVCNTDYYRARAWGDDLGCFWYRGGVSLGQASADLMLQWQGKSVPNEVILKCMEEPEKT